MIPQHIKYIAAAVSLFFQLSGKAQFSVSAQLRTRTELRDGQGGPLSKGQQPAFFTSQRTRLNLGFNSSRLKLGVSIQDVRVWGQDVSMINRTSTADFNGFMLHEAWADILLSDSNAKASRFSLKIGRQELIYDDQRLLGNLDWLQQARRHDAALFKYEHTNWLLHLGGAYNQNREKSSGTLYDGNPPGNYTSSTNDAPMYKAMEFLYASRKWKEGKVGLLFFSDQFNHYQTDSVNGTPVKTFTPGTWSRATTGLYFNHTAGKFGLTGAAYFQFGKNGRGASADGQFYSLFASHKKGKLLLGLGADISTDRFDPLYGTPHKFWGLMDYFYAGSATGNHGLADYYLKSSFKASNRLSMNLDLHHFSAYSAVPGYSKTYGQEADLVGNYQLNPIISFEAGYAHFFSAPALSSASVKRISNARSNANWAYLMINIKPEFLFK